MVVDLNKLYVIDYFDENTFLYHEESMLAEDCFQKDIDVVVQLKQA